MKSIIRLICIFVLVLTITLYFDPFSLNEMFLTDEIESTNVLCLRGGWTSNTEECQKKSPIYKNSARYAAPNLPNLLTSSNEFSDDSDPENEFNWSRRKNDPGSWSQYQQECQDQTRKGQTCDLMEIVSRIKEDSQLINYAESAGKSQAIQKELNAMIEKLRLGNEQN